jgi:cytochrome P450
VSGSLTEIHPQTGEIPAFPMNRAARCPLDPPPGVMELQAQAPILRVKLWDGSTPWLVTRQAQIRALLIDERVSADDANAGFPHINRGYSERRTVFRTFLGMDDPEHARLRRMVAAPFTVRRIKLLQPGIQEVVDGLISGMLAGPKPTDLVETIALPVPSLVICQLLGVPYADHQFFQRTARLLITPGTTPEEAREGREALIAYIDRLVDEKLNTPGDDLLSRVAEEHVRSGELSRADLVRMGLLMLGAGHETTANMIALGILALLRHPGQLALVRETEDPADLGRVVEELMRYLSVIHLGLRRVALADIEIDGLTIRAGEGMILACNAGDRDDRVYTEPDRLDVRRGTRGQLAFGFGTHQCLGQALARLELQVVYGTLFRRVPTLALATSMDSLSFKEQSLTYGVFELPVTW